MFCSGEKKKAVRNNKNRKLCSDEIGGVKMRKNEKKKHILQIQKMYFLYCSFLVAPLASLHFKDDL
jgi:hypothetical protein